ncbi:hypothetical protein FHG87_005324 [Trinorchestia longiramus]|nr:hypothetical protein FHG87_005324 [Trinorchestia longiramus]
MFGMNVMAWSRRDLKSWRCCRIRWGCLQQAGSSSDAFTWLVHLHGMTQDGPRGITSDDPGSQEKNSGIPSCCMFSELEGENT